MNRLKKKLRNSLFLQNSTYNWNLSLLWPRSWGKLFLRLLLQACCIYFIEAMSMAEIKKCHEKITPLSSSELSAASQLRQWSDGRMRTSWLHSSPELWHFLLLSSLWHNQACSYFSSRNKSVNASCLSLELKASFEFIWQIGCTGVTWSLVEATFTITYFVQGLKWHLNKLRNATIFSPSNSSNWEF